MNKFRLKFSKIDWHSLENKILNFTKNSSSSKRVPSTSKLYYLCSIYLVKRAGICPHLYRFTTPSDHLINNSKKNGAMSILPRSFSKSRFYIFKNSHNINIFEALKLARIKYYARKCMLTSGEASPTFGHANFSVFINRIRNQFLKK